jgi:Na+-driven multidrug efflux pump
MGLTSTIMVGHLGSAALASAGLGGSLYFTLVIVCRSVLAAVAPLAAHAIGADVHLCNIRCAKRHRDSE